MKLWEKGYKIDDAIERFTVGKDKELDLLLAPYDILGTMAHVTMLESVGLLSKQDLDLLLPALRELYAEAQQGHFVIEEGIEDVHSQVELMLTRRLGEVGKKVHTGRSRNDQVLVDLKLFTRAEIEKTMKLVERLFEVLQMRSDATKHILMPGYTHLQVAMPSSFGLWLGAYAEALTDDMRLLVAAYEQANLNPLGSAAGYGSSAPLNRTMTTQLLGFADLDYNAIYAQMNRGRMERTVAFAYSSVAETLGRLAMDCCMFNSQNFGFIKSGAVREYSDRLIQQYDVRSGQGSITIARSMSGGNQQKAIIAREIDKDPQLLIAVQPTRGLDVGAIEYIHKQIIAQRDAGKAVLLVSLELDEVMNLSDRILVMYEGEIVGEFDPKTTDVQTLGLYMAGAKRMEG